MIRIEWLSLPAGLRAIAHRDSKGDLVIYVSDALDARRQRVAVMQAVRASRRAGWRAGLPIAVALFGGLRLWLRHAATAIRARPAAWAAAATGAAGVTAVAGLILVTTPHQHGPSASAPPPAGGAGAPHQPGQHQQHASGGRGGHLHPIAALPTSPGASAGQPQSNQTTPAGGGPSSAPAPAPSPSRSTGPGPTPSPSASAAPSPSPSPSPPAQGSPGSCVIILGVRVCVPLISLSLRV